MVSYHSYVSVPESILIMFSLFSHVQPHVEVAVLRVLLLLPVWPSRHQNHLHMGDSSWFISTYLYFWDQLNHLPFLSSIPIPIQFFTKISTKRWSPPLRAPHRWVNGDTAASQVDTTSKTFLEDLSRALKERKVEILLANTIMSLGPAGGPAGSGLGIDVPFCFFFLFFTSPWNT